MKNIAKVGMVLGVSMIMCDIAQRMFGLNAEFMGLLSFIIAMVYGLFVYLDSAPKMIDIDHRRTRERLFREYSAKGYTIQEMEYIFNRLGLLK